MADAAGSGDAGSAMRNSIACEPCRHKKRKCDKILPSCQHCSQDPSRCHYPEQNKRGLPPGFTAKLVARLAETEAALFHVLSQAHNHDAPPGTEGLLATPPTVRSGNQDKADSLREWESLPLRSDGEIEAWFRWKSAGRGPHGASTREATEYRHSHDPRTRSSYQPYHVPDFSAPQPSPGHDRPAGSPAAARGSASEVSSGRAKELSESQHNMYF